MAEVPHLVKMQENFGSNNFTVLGLMQGSTAKAIRFSQSHPLNYPILAQSQDFEAFHIFFLPVTYLVDPNGRIVADDLEEAEAILRQQQSL